jgi:hypothetical protein
MGCGYATHMLFPASPAIRGATERTLRSSVQTRKQHEHGTTPTSPSLETRIVERRNKVSHPSHPGSAAQPPRRVNLFQSRAPPLASILHPTLNTPTPHHDPILTHTKRPAPTHLQPRPQSPHLSTPHPRKQRRHRAPPQQPALPKAVSRSGAG